MEKVRSIAVIPAGEQWEDGSLRPCVEDLLGAGAMISYLRGKLLPESNTAVSVFDSFAGDLSGCRKNSVSEREKVERGEDRDIELASALNVGDCVPILQNGAFVQARGDVTV